MNDHHLILGTLVDVLTGETLDDTHDERYRQNLARLLVEDRQFAPGELIRNVSLTAETAGKKARLKIDIIVRIDGTDLMLVKYGPGSIITRHRPALAASRLISGRQIPRVVVTNGEDADILDGKSGRLLGRGLDAVPDRETLVRLGREHPPEPVSPDRARLESRILYAFDVDGSCPCDTDICRIEP
ncbi:hypothetical protein JCM14469_01820 [Desulfatiferula olefinivorans]